MNLSDVFAAVAHKRIVPVDLPSARQHELNATAALRGMFGTDGTTSGALSWHYFADDKEPERVEGGFTFYDARELSAARTGRSEWRFYYTGEFLSRAKAGDLLILPKTKTGAIFGLLFEKNSAWERAALALFNLTAGEVLPNLHLADQSELTKVTIRLLQCQILEELNMDSLLPAMPSDEDVVMEEFGKSWPKTAVMSAFARSRVEVDLAKPDEALSLWLEREEQLFRALEGVHIRERIAAGFSAVDDFIQYSLSVQNRRKSRMGHALQNHLSELFGRKNLRFTAQCKTEGSSKPDFIFPGESDYHGEKFDASLLVMLGVKSSSKDRWRQILTEADRIKNKHLCTMEAGISVNQTNEMTRHNVTLVMPAMLHQTFTPKQGKSILSVEEFIQMVAKKER